MTIYEKLKEANVKLDHHESDLYAEVTDASSDIVSNYKYKDTVTFFTNDIDNKLWYEIPFAYDLWWNIRLARLTGNRLNNLGEVTK